MPLEDISTFQILKAKLDYTNERQRLIAQNVANADTPDYAPSDLKPFNFDVAIKQAMNTGAVSMVQTHPGHMSVARPKQGPWRPDVKPDTEARLDGNTVVLEDQMAKMTEARLEHDAAIAFYQQSLTLLKTAAKAPGK
jgi:flagellar basal-body rod protein FlgB